ncbi:hypothetical protein DPMN_172129 [Dreissena polymorpha]|uniref:Uncharacterized protein n=1 Tax=Dreissena polymorpha TaxID=45954 RepID=A0A9D4E102_DREPO|nr:hypothetical protein DPMN_172129 [Dreissena polymorpha]
MMPDVHSSSCLLLTLAFVVLTCSQEQSPAPAGIRLSVPESEFNRYWSMSGVFVIGKATSPIQSQRKLEVEIGSVSIQYTFQAVMKGGSLALKIGRCSLEISQLSVKSTECEPIVCRNLTELNVVVQNKIASSHLKQSYSKFGENVTIDATFLSMNMSKGAFHTLHKGDVCFNGKCLAVTDTEFSHEPPSDGISFDIKKEVLDNAIILLKETKVLDIELTFRTISSRWPERVVGVRMRVENIRLSM